MRKAGGRRIVTLCLLNCTEVRSVASPTHPSSQDDVDTIATKAQTVNAQAEGFGELNLMETLCPFQLFHSNGVEWLGAELARACAPRWFGESWSCPLFFKLTASSGRLDRSVTVPDQSETQSPTGSMRPIRSMASTSTRSGSVTSGSWSTTFLPPMESIPDILTSNYSRGLAQVLCLASHNCARTLSMMAQYPTRQSSILETHG